MHAPSASAALHAAHQHRCAIRREEVINSYGELSPAELLRCYGFVERSDYPSPSEAHAQSQFQPHSSPPLSSPQEGPLSVESPTQKRAYVVTGPPFQGSNCVAADVPLVFVAEALLELLLVGPESGESAPASQQLGSSRRSLRFRWDDRDPHGAGDGTSVGSSMGRGEALSERPGLAKALDKVVRSAVKKGRVPGDGWVRFLACGAPHRDTTRVATAIARQTLGWEKEGGGERKGRRGGKRCLGKEPREAGGYGETEKELSETVALALSWAAHDWLRCIEARGEGEEDDEKEKGRQMEGAVEEGAGRRNGRKGVGEEPDAGVEEEKGGKDDEKWGEVRREAARLVVETEHR